MKNETIKVLEQEGKLFGLPLSDFGIWVALTIALVILPNITDVVGIKLGLWYWMFVIVFSITTNKVMKRFAKKKYPKYVMSVIGGFMQPKVIGAKYGDTAGEKKKEKEEQ